MLVAVNNPHLFDCFKTQSRFQIAARLQVNRNLFIATSILKCKNRLGSTIKPINTTVNSLCKPIHFRQQDCWSQRWICRRLAKLLFKGDCVPHRLIPVLLRLMKKHHVLKIRPPANPHPRPKLACCGRQQLSTTYCSNFYTYPFADLSRRVVRPTWHLRPGFEIYLSCCWLYEDRDDRIVHAYVWNAPYQLPDTWIIDPVERLTMLFKFFSTRSWLPSSNSNQVCL